MSTLAVSFGLSTLVELGIDEPNAPALAGASSKQRVVMVVLIILLAIQLGVLAFQGLMR